MILPIVLDTCTILNLLRIDEEDEFLYKKLRKLDIRICRTVYDEANKNVNIKNFSEDQKEYILSHTPHFGKRIYNCEEYFEFEEEYKDNIKQFCNYKKENGEFYSTLICLHICRKENRRLYFYTDDYPAKLTFDSYFNYQQIGTIGDTVDLLVFLYWINPDFNQQKLEKYLRNLLSEFAPSFKKFHNQFTEKKQAWITNNVKNIKMIENLNGIEDGLKKLDLGKIETGIAFFRDHIRIRVYRDINSFLDSYLDINLSGYMVVKIKETVNRLREHPIYKMSC